MPTPTPSCDRPMTGVPPLPSGDAPPTLGAIAEGLASSLPDADRDAGRLLLAERILPDALAGVTSHPHPRRLAEVVYEGLAERLNTAAPEDRLDALELAADETEIRALSSRALSLAVGRYLSAEPDAIERAGHWLDAEADRWRARPAGDIADAASAVLEDLEAWAERMREQRPQVFETRRMDYVNAKLAGQSASSGSFETSTGPLSDFLSKVGKPSARLDIR